MPQEVKCPRCSVPLIIRDGSPPRLTCPRCLAMVFNPNPAPVNPNAAPRKVLPLESDVSTDTRFTAIGLVALGVSLLVGAFLTMLISGSLVLTAVLLIVAVGIIGLIVATWNSGRRQAQSLGPPPRPPDFDQSGVLNYQPVRAYRNEPGILVLPFLGGFFGSLLACGLAFVLFAATLETPQPTRMLIAFLAMAALVGLAVGSGFLGKRKGFSGIGRGTAIGLALGMFALGPCAFCYVLV
jgi:hypothetical protein